MAFGLACHLSLASPGHPIPLATTMDGFGEGQREARKLLLGIPGAGPFPLALILNREDSGVPAALSATTRREPTIREGG